MSELAHVADYLPPCFRQEPVLRAVSKLVPPPPPGDQYAVELRIPDVGYVTVHYERDQENPPVIVTVWAGSCDITELISAGHMDDIYSIFDEQIKEAA